MTTIVPESPFTGEKLLSEGGGMNTNPALAPLPDGVITCMAPVAPEPTTASIVESLTTDQEVAATFPNLTAVVPVKFTPFMVTVSPCAAVAGLKEPMEGSPRVLRSTNKSRLA